jgi:hypothetical protein
LEIHIPPFRVVDVLSVHGRTKAEIYSWLRRKLWYNGVDIRNMDMEMPYELPYHYSDEGKAFIKPEEEELMELCALRSNAHRVMKYFVKYFLYSAQATVSPSSFQSETYLPFFLESAGKTGSYVKIGFSPPDSYIDHHYFYVTHWPVENTVAYYLSLRKIKGGGYWADLQWLNAILPLNILLKDTVDIEQAMRVTSFLSSALENTFQLLETNLAK